MPTPWPSWLIAAHPTRAPADALRPFLDALSGYVRAFDAPAQRAAADVAFIKEKFGYPEADIEVRAPPPPFQRRRLLLFMCACVLTAPASPFDRRG